MGFRKGEKDQNARGIKTTVIDEGMHFQTSHKLCSFCNIFIKWYKISNCTSNQE